MQKGFGVIPVVIIGVLIISLGIGGYFAYQNNFQNIRKINSFENCQKAGYPINGSPALCSTPNGQKFLEDLKQEELKPKPAASDNTANWKTYTNTKIGFQLKYPSSKNPYILKGERGGQPVDTDGAEDDQVIYFPLDNQNYDVGLIVNVFPFLGSLESATKVDKGFSNHSGIGPTKVDEQFLIDGQETIWQTYLEEGKNPSHEVYLVAKNHAFVFGSGIETDKELTKQILSTFKFLDQKDGVVSCIEQKDPKIDSQITQLILSADPDKFSKSAGMYYKNGKTRVIIETKEKIDLLKISGLIVESEYANLVQALLPLNKFCEVKKFPEVLFIRTSSGLTP